MQILKGAPVAAAIRDEIKKELEGCETKPCLAIVRVGEKQEDLSYERSALKRMSGVGIETKLFVFPADISMDDFSAKFAAINDDPTIDGILLFRPLPSQLNESQIVESIAPEKDVEVYLVQRLESCFQEINTHLLRVLRRLSWKFSIFMALSRRENEQLYLDEVL